MPLKNAGPRGPAVTKQQIEALTSGSEAASPHTLEQLETLSATVAKINHAAKSHAAQLDCVLANRGRIERLRLSLNKRLVGLLLPPNAEDAQFYLQCGQLYADLAAVCQRIIRQAPKGFEQNWEDLKLITQACYWAIRFMGDRVRCAFCAYTREPADIWLQIHEIYQHALTYELTRNPVRDDAKQRHIRHVYKRMLLFGICDPYQFPFSVINGVFDDLDDWAKLAHLRKGKPTGDKFLFLINPQTDRPAVPILPKLSLGVDTLYLDTSQLVDVLNLDLNTYADIEARNGRLHPHADLQTREMLKTLIVSWGVHADRHAERRHLNAMCELVTSLSSITALLSSAQRNRNHEFRVHRGLQLVDESASGARICLEQENGARVRIGELIAMKGQHENAWCVGMIRWGQTDIDNRFTIGVHKFTDEAYPVTISFDEKNERRFSPIPAIWLMQKTGDERGPSLIINRRFYTPGERIYVQRAGGYACFEPGKVILSTRYFVWFGIVSVDPGFVQSCEIAPAKPTAKATGYN